MAEAKNGASLTHANEVGESTSDMAGIASDEVMRTELLHIHRQRRKIQGQEKAKLNKNRLNRGRTLHKAVIRSKRKPQSENSWLGAKATTEQ